MFSRFLRFCTLFDLLVVKRLYGLPITIKTTRTLKFQRLRLKKDFYIIVTLKGKKVFQTALNGKSQMNMSSISNQDVRQNKMPWLAVSLSWLIAGAGQLYGGYWLRGFAFLVMTLLLHILLFFCGISVKCPIGISIAIALCTSIVWPIFVCTDSFKLIRKSNTEEFEQVRSSSKDPWLAVILSLIFYTILT